MSTNQLGTGLMMLLGLVYNWVDHMNMFIWGTDDKLRLDFGAQSTLLSGKRK